MQKKRALILRSNRFLVSSFLDKGLITDLQMEAANEKFMEATQSSETLRNISILEILLYELKALDEVRLLDHLVDEFKIGLIDLNQIDPSKLPFKALDISLCRSTLTIPFDKFGETCMLATCYYMSAPVVRHWEEFLGGRVIWYTTSMGSMNHYLERVENVLNETEPEIG